MPTIYVKDIYNTIIFPQPGRDIPALKQYERSRDIDEMMRSKSKRGAGKGKLSKGFNRG